jgi:hypothetical protein
VTPARLKIIALGLLILICIAAIPPEKQPVKIIAPVVTATKAIPKVLPPVPACPLTIAQRDRIERIIMTSCGNQQNYEMDMANAQVIKDRADSGLFGASLDDVINAPGQFERPTSGEVNNLVKQAVSAVFDRGERVTQDKLYYYINPNTEKISMKRWKTGKRLVIMIGTGKWIHQYWTRE